MWKNPQIDYWDTSGVTITFGELLETGWSWADVSYEIYDINHKLDFQEKFNKHFYFREIGQETPARFTKMLEARLCEIMPTYKHMFKGMELLQNAADPLQAYDLTETYTREGENKGKTENVGRFSNTPQGSVDNIDTYLTEANKADSESSDTSKETYTMTRKGNIGVQPLGYEITEYVKAYRNIDELIIADLECLFLKVY